MTATPWIHLHHSGQPRRPDGLYPLLLDLHEDAQRVQRLVVVSGSPRWQHFRTAADPASWPGNSEPIPEGRYLCNLTDWAAGRGNWAAVHSAAIGPWWNRLDPLQAMARSDFGHHMDWNYLEGFPGTAGCVGHLDRSSAQVWLNWMARWKDPVHQVVDYGLGSVQLPDWSKPDEARALLTVKLYLNDNRVTGLVGGKRVRTLDLELKMFEDGSLHCRRDGTERRLDWARVEIGERQ